MKIYNVKYSERAKNELLDIWRYIAVVLENPASADKTIEKILQKNESLKVFPSGAPMWGKVLEIELRVMRAGNYVSFYSIDEKNSGVLIRNVIYVRRDILKIIMEKDDQR